MSKWEKVLRKLLPYRNAKRFLFNDNFRLNKENRWREKKRKKNSVSRRRNYNGAGNIGYLFFPQIITRK